MKLLDRILQHWRIGKARSFLHRGDRVLDIGSADGALFCALHDLSPQSLGIDPTLSGPVVKSGKRLLAGFFPQDMPTGVGEFDAITMLAVLEHFPEEACASLQAGCARFLRPGGRLVITVPSPLVDQILKVLVALRLVDGMSFEEHHGFDVSETARLFGPPAFKLVLHKRFQLGLNNLFVFERIDCEVGLSRRLS